MTSRNHRNLRSVPTHPAYTASPCTSWATLLPDAAEGLLSEAEQRALDSHLSSCVACAEELAEAQRGLAWLGVLKDHTPEPPLDLLSNILAQTTGCAEAGVSLPELPPFLSPADLPVAALGQPAWESAGQHLLSWLRGDAGTWSSLLQPRLAMTAAMAFFSICLTLNLLGISVTQLDAQTLRRGSLERTVSDTGATIVRSLHGLRVVYRVESRMNDMRAQKDGPETSSPTH